MPKRPRDPNQLAKLIVDIATGEVEDTVSVSRRHPPKQRAGGLKGGSLEEIAMLAEEAFHPTKRGFYKKRVSN